MKDEVPCQHHAQYPTSSLIEHTFLIKTSSNKQMRIHLLCVVLVLIISLAVCFTSVSAERSFTRRRQNRIERALLKLKKLERALADGSFASRPTCNCIRAPCHCAGHGFARNNIMSDEPGSSLPTFASPSVPTTYSAPWSSSGSTGSSTSLPTLGITPGKLPSFSRIGSPSFGVSINSPPPSPMNPTYKLPDFSNLFNNNNSPINSYTLPKVPGNTPGSLPIFARPTTPTFSSPSFNLHPIGINQKPGKIQIPTLPTTGPTPLTPPRFPSMITNPPKIPLPVSKPSSKPPAPAGNGAAGTTAANWVLAQQGKPYSQAQDKRHGPNYFDCSALVKEAWAKAGKNLPETTRGYPGKGMKEVSVNEMKPGDVVYRTGHVGMYVGNGKIVSAESTAGVKERPVAQYQRVIGFTTVYRP